MNKRDLFSRSLVLRIFSLFLLSLFAIPVYALQKPLNANYTKWAVILSPGPKHGVPWGGYHVTIAGYSIKNGGHNKKHFLENAYKSVFHNSPWHLHGTLPELVKWRGTYTQIFKSHILDQLSDRLIGGGFDNIKGPRHGNVPWHISLHGDHALSKRKIDEFKHSKTNWYLWHVPESSKACQEHGTGCPSWQKIH